MRPAEKTRTTERRLSLAVFIAVMLASIGLNVLFDGAAWWFELAVVSAVVIGAAGLTRVFTRNRVAPSLVAVVVLVAFVVARFAADTAILLVFPTGDTIGRIAGLAGGAPASIQNQSLPVTADPSILLLLIVGIGIVAIMADFLAVGLRMPALAGIPLLVPLAVPAMTDFDLSDGFAFVLAAVGYLWLVLAGTEHRRVGLSVATGAFAIVAALVVPFALPPAQAVGGGDSGLVSTGINPTINLGKDLKATVNTTALIYSMNNGDSEYLRLVTLDKFAGEDWAPDPPKQVRSHDMAAFPPPAGLGSKVATTLVTTKITIGNLRSPWLPLPYPTSSVQGLWGQWYWEADSLAASSPDAGIQNQNYQVTSRAIHPTPEQLSAAGSTVPSGFDRYLELPAALPAIISDTARQVAGGEQGSYAKAVALQQYFRSSAFTYSVKAPIAAGYDGTSMAVVAKFLQEKSGYCVHFASAMAVMARSLGIPARIAVGFQPGSALDTDADGHMRYRVTTHDLHTWPELYFAGIGWVPFEPTPGRGEVPSYADLSVPGVPAPLSPAQLAAQSTASPAPATGLDARGNKLSDLSVGAANGAQLWASWIWAGGGLVVLILVLLLPALRRRLVRTARLRAAKAGEAWQEVVDTAEDLRLRLPPTLTPGQIAAALAPVAGGEHLDRLRLAMERESFASGPPPLVDAADVRAVRARMLTGATSAQRLVARLAPPTAWRRALGVFRSGGRINPVRYRRGLRATQP